jgi:protein-S-isoprenylcysteine O-methyltransferase Ste14
VKYVLKHLVALLLPLTVLVIVPALLEQRRLVASGWQLVGGVLLLLIGLALMAMTIASFARTGGGTLAPWSPPQHLVVRGLYAYVRNPMILGVLVVLLGEALTFRSWPILLFAVFAFLLNTVYFIFSEEPGLEKRFGEEYRAYKRNVPRWLPRRSPWTPEERAG